MNQSKDSNNLGLEIFSEKKNMKKAGCQDLCKGSQGANKDSQGAPANNGAKSGSNAFTNNLPIGEVKQGSNQGKVCCRAGEKKTSGTGKLN
ncbi:hypothetical protein SLA2020_072620 [Shorea laevis]